MQLTFAILIPMLFLAYGLPVLVIVGCVLLQIFLSKKEGKWLGLILPSISFCYSLLTVLNLTAFNNSPLEVFRMIVLVFFISNIPTIILMAIYFSCRGKLKAKKQLDKMNIQDL